MKFLRALSLVVLVLSLLVFLGSFPVESSYSGKAQLIQRVRKDAGSDLFGDAGTPVGSPQELIIEDKGAFLPDKSPEGAAMVDEGYLEKNKIYPLQLKTVKYISGMSRLGSGIAFLLSAAAFVFSRKRVHKIPPQTGEQGPSN